MDKVTKTVVNIGGREYTMRGFESEEYIHNVAIYVDKKMEEIEERQLGLSTSMLYVLTAVNLADEVLKLKGQVAKLQNQVNNLEQQLAESSKKDEATKRNNTPIIYDVARRARK
ncbi:MAG: cell division protein ZapA [Xylanivirga thermophila]|uniref:cell division protein ZapA n=1 Tax=Xylanivirga thermophila TaxID=2496273 RepID=UPI0013EAA90E|nr:cell division protein ZapA [Xylanivirga thermophila]